MKKINTEKLTPILNFSKIIKQTITFLTILPYHSTKLKYKLLVALGPVIVL